MVSEQILSFYKSLAPPNGLPPAVRILNPYKTTNGQRLSKQFYQKYYADNAPRRILFGINPGRFGGGVTGIPFTDPIVLENECGIKNTLNKRAELSSKFIYEMIHAYGGPDTFYSKFYISAMSPLGYVQNGKNLNYYDIPNWKDLFYEYATELIKEQLDFSIDTTVAYSIGQGDNLKFLNWINTKAQFFDKIVPLPHPRWVMQYRLKRKETYINEYLEKLSENTISHY